MMVRWNRKIMRGCLIFSLAGCLVFLSAGSEVTALAAAESAEEEIVEEEMTEAESTAAEAEDDTETSDSSDTIVLRICNWEEYIDEGDWDDEEVIELDNGVSIFGENSMIEDFEEWYYETYGQKVEVEYSCFGTNEELYTLMSLGNEYDLVCPSDYMFMKLIAEDKVLAYSDEFFDTSVETNYYINNVSPYIKNIYDTNEINSEAWSKYAAGYMWGITGMVYDPEEVTAEEMSSLSILLSDDYSKQISIKDSSRDSYFMALAIYKQELLCSEEFRQSEDYSERLQEEMNDVSSETIAGVEEILTQISRNAYSFETDSGKADIVAGKIVGNYQWSGDAVYSMDQAEEDDVYLEFAVPEECTNIWMDGWVMLKDGIGDDAAKQQAAEAFVNFISMPENAVRNMYYIGYTSVIAGNEDNTTMYEYANWCYASEDEEDVVEYPLGYFFSGDNADEDYVVLVDEEEASRQIFAQYPTEEVLQRATIMEYYSTEKMSELNQMWINIRCFHVLDYPIGVWVAILAAVAVVVLLCLRKRYVRMHQYER
ncbi:MAG: extracellular solute-binding protein [Clostridiales bacterium]|nr:extracellular solute-binding protein [Clostridiales bacterium]